MPAARRLPVAGRCSRVRRRDRTPTSFVSFDLLAVDGQVVVNRPHHEPRQLLERLGQLAGDALSIVPSLVDVDDLVVACDESDLEGVVLKRSNSRYRSGRSKDWRKVRPIAGADPPVHSSGDRER